jgi:diguanylate cyclase (GGDEF)-like protein
MPEMDGYAVLVELKKNEKTQDIPIIFVTGLSHSDYEEKGLTLGAADYITKPFSSAIVKLRVLNQIKMQEQLRIINKLSMFDQLTGLANRRSFDIRQKSEWDRAVRAQYPLSVLMIDVDRFKNYNDTYGHLQGDVALQTVANVLTDTLKRSSDFPSRWGGEEFVVLLPNTDLSGAVNIAEKIRENIENTIIHAPNSLVTKITVSIGVNSELNICVRAIIFDVSSSTIRILFFLISSIVSTISFEVYR